MVEQIPFSTLAKLSCGVGEPEDVLKCGELEFYDKVPWRAWFGCWFWFWGEGG